MTKNMKHMSVYLKILTEAGKKSPILCRWWDELHSTARKEEKRKRS